FVMLTLIVGAARLEAQSFPSALVPSRWEGQAALGAAPLKMALSIEADSERAPDHRVLLDVPECGVLGRPANTFSVSGDRLRFSMRLMASLALFSARVHDNQMDGVANLGAPIPIHLTRVAFPELPYRIEPITVAHDSIRLSASLLVPSSPGPHPAMVFHFGA